jgi:DNA-binding CsgD family transcriptional regulator
MPRRSKQTDLDVIAAELSRSSLSFESYVRLYPGIPDRLKSIWETEDPVLKPKIAALKANLAARQQNRLAHLARRFQLTPAEARIAIFLADGGSVGQYAKKARVSEQTVRTHVKAIFRKLGVSRQGELTAIVLKRAATR